MPTSCRELPESTLVDQVRGTAEAKTGRQGYMPRSEFATPLANKTQGTIGSHANIPRDPYRICSDNVHIGLPHGLSFSKTCERPAVVDEQKAYWVVKKPPCNLPCTMGGRSGDSVHNAYKPVSAETLSAFIQRQHPEEYFPLLSSRQHNFGVIFHLEDSWIGLNIVAKTEAAYAEFQKLLELQLIQSYIECFVTGPPLRSGIELFGTTATGKAQLCIKVLQSTVCRTAGCEDTRHCNVNGVSSAGSASAVVSHVIFRISFPPILLPDILWCNGLALTSNPYFRATADGAEECYGSLCCFALTFPQVELHAPRDILEKTDGNSASRLRYERKGKMHFQAFSLAGRLPTFNPPLQYPIGLGICAGLLTVSPIVFYELFPRVVEWLRSAKDNCSTATLEHTCWVVNGFINGISKIRQLLESQNFPIVFTNFASWRKQIDYSDAEILFGQVEGKPWLDMLQ